MANEKDTSGLPLSVAAVDCGRKVLLSLSGACAVVAGIGWLVEHPELLRAVGAVIGDVIAATWTAALWAASLGGSFWGAVFVGVAAIAVAAWGFCVNCKAERGFSERATVIGGVACLVIWFLAFRGGMNLTPDGFEGISAYMAGAMVILCAPWAVLFSVIFGCGVALLNEAQ